MPAPAPTVSKRSKGKKAGDTSMDMSDISFGIDDDALEAVLKQYEG